MPLRVVHVVVTRNFAGVERYVANVALESARRGIEVAVVGGNPTQMSAVLGDTVRWLPGGTAGEASRSLASLGRREVCHAHMTAADVVAIVTRPLHRAPIISTRHFAAPRGSMLMARALRPLIGAGIAREIAISEFVAAHLERRPDLVLPNAVPPSACLWRPSNRSVLVLQRLHKEKDTVTALRAWQLSHLWEDGWSLRIVGAGAERSALEDLARKMPSQGVTFVGWVADVDNEFAQAGVLLAPAPAEPFGLAVVEAMAAGVPVVACAAGGHLETVGRLSDAASFPAHDAEAAASALRSMLDDGMRRAASKAGRKLAREELSLERHVDRLLETYPRPPRARPAGARRKDDGELTQLVFCSLEAWDQVWRRNQFLVDILLRRNPRLRVLFVEPPTDPFYDLSRRRRPAWPGLRTIGYDGRLTALRPVKVLPRRVGATADNLLRAQVRLAVRHLGFARPTLWINDVTYAPLIRATGWSSLYDVTDDWLAAPFSSRELARLAELEQIALDDANEVVVCSQSLADSRGKSRRVHLVPNAVDAAHFRRPRPRPTDLPVGGQVAVYVGSLHESRLDVNLISETAKQLSSVDFAFVGPNALAPTSFRRLSRHPNIHLLGARPHAAVPAYLQHADVLIIPHRVTQFTDSLDPIKAYECLAVGKPTVSTPVAGFRDHEPSVTIASASEFPAAVEQALSSETSDRLEALPTWDVRVDTIERVLAQARTLHSESGR